MHQELDVNIEGIDVVFNLLQKIDALQKRIVNVQIGYAFVKVSLISISLL
jgi:hypothetical protein